METHENKYNEIIKKLRKTEPALSNPETITNNIMSQVCKPDVSRSIKIIRLVRPWLAIASMFLIVLFIYQQSETPEPLPKKELVFSQEKTPVKACLDSLAFEANDKDRLLKIYMCYMQQEELKKKNSELIKQKLLLKF